MEADTNGIAGLGLLGRGITTCCVTHRSQVIAFARRDDRSLLPQRERFVSVDVRPNPLDRQHGRAGHLCESRCRRPPHARQLHDHVSHLSTHDRRGVPRHRKGKRFYDYLQQDKEYWERLFHEYAWTIREILENHFPMDQADD